MAGEKETTSHGFAKALLIEGTHRLKEFFQEFFGYRAKHL